MIDEIGFIIFIICFTSYFGLLQFSFKRKKPSKFKVFQKIYQNWVNCRLDADSPLTGVQALRNFIMGGSTFVSALFVLLGLIVGFYQTKVLVDGNFFGIQGLSTLLVMISTIILMIVFCLINFILSIRYSARLSLLITGGRDEHCIGSFSGPRVTSGTLINAQKHWMYGVRGIFYLVSVLSWLVSPVIFILLSIGITIYLLNDHDIL